MVDLSDKDVLRDVTLDGTGYRLVTWDAQRLISRRPQHQIGYAFYAPDGAVLFTGEDFGCSPMDAIDSDECLRSLLGFLTLGEHDTDSDYFAEYTAEQIAFRDGNDREYLSLWGMEPGGENEPPAFVDNETKS